MDAALGMSFAGFPKAGVTFLRELDRHNERSWFNERKDLYLSEVQAPLQSFVHELAVSLRSARIPLAPNPKNPTFRIYRDVRFSKDKRPYNTHVSAALHRNGDVTDAGVLYVHIDPNAPFVAAGFYRPERPALDALRVAAYTDSKILTKLVTGLESDGLTLMRDDTLVRVPPAFRDAVETAAEPFVKLKSFVVRRSIDVRLISTPQLLEDIVHFARAAKPFLIWGWKAIDAA